MPPDNAYATHAATTHFPQPPKRVYPIPNPGPPRNGSLTLLVGIPGSGKTTWAHEYITTWRAARPPRGHIHHVSSDALRQRHAGDINDMSQNARIFTLMHEQIQHALGQGTHVVADATHTNQGRLNAYLSRIIRLFPGLTVRVIAFPCDPALARARIDQDLTRGVDRANVPDAALEAQAVQATATLDWLDRTFAQEA